MSRLLLITDEESDLSLLLRRVFTEVTVLSSRARYADPDGYDALCILGGNTDEGIVLNAPLRMCADAFRAQGKPMLCEFARSVASSQIRGLLPTTHHRMVFSDKAFAVPGLVTGDVLDGHENAYIRYGYVPDVYPILSCHEYVCAHSHIDMSEEEYKKGIPAMWRSDNLLVCAFRLCNFRRARLAPRRSFEALIAAILRFLAGETVEVSFEAPVCRYEAHRVEKASDVREAVRRGIAWFENADMLNDGGRDGVQEGLAHHISAKNGKQKRAVQVRADCTGEVAGAFMLHGLLAGKEDALAIAEEAFRFIFDYFQVKEGYCKGMIRWTEVAWEQCYADDVARAMLGLLLRQHFDGKIPHFEEICLALDFLADSTNLDGVRAAVTDMRTLDKAKLAAGRTVKPCAHFNCYYHAVLLLAYRAGGDKRYLETAERGLGCLMSHYPETLRETSETEENCRLLFPLAVLYEITGKAEHYEWISRIMAYIDEHRHECGAILEWDTGYKANCARNHTGECALLANNGDPVADLLYSNNWLPLGFAYAYFATGEERFRKAWCDTASFLLSCQTVSENKLLDGAWMRAFDVEAWEAYGVPHDAGWAPCCIETGWTVGEILMGLQFMEQAERLRTPTANL